MTLPRKVIDCENNTVTYYEDSTGFRSKTVVGRDPLLGLPPFKNESGLTFADISSESFRTYDYGNKTVTIKNPIYLNVSKSGGHRLFDAEGFSHYVPNGWVHIFWKAKDGQPNFVK